MAIDAKKENTMDTKVVTTTVVTTVTTTRVYVDTPKYFREEKHPNPHDIGVVFRDTVPSWASGVPCYAKTYLASEHTGIAVYTDRDHRSYRKVEYLYTLCPRCTKPGPPVEHGKRITCNHCGASMKVYGNCLYVW